MLKKKNRADRKTIEQIFKEGVFINTENLTFKFILNKNLNIPTISFIIPKTVSKSAIKRNYLKRRGYVILKKYFNKLPSNITGVFIFGKKSLECFSGRKTKDYNPTQNLENEIKNIFNKIN